MPDSNTNLTVRVFLALTVFLALVNTYAQFRQVVYHDPVWLISMLAPGLLAIIYDTYKANRNKITARLKRVLVIEDSPLSQGMVSLVLEQSGLDRIIIADSGDQAMNMLGRVGEYALTPIPDIIILDMNLPDCPSSEVLCFIRECADPAINKLPVIAMSSDIPENVSGDLTGVSVWVEKSVSFRDDLIEALHTIASQPKPGIIAKATTILIETKEKLTQQ